MNYYKPKWKRIRKTHSTSWYPASPRRKGAVNNYYYRIETRGRGGTFKYKLNPWRSFEHDEYVDEDTPKSLAWKGLKKAWIAFYIHLRYQEHEEMEFYSYIIQGLQEKLGLPITHFYIQDSGNAQDNYYKTRKFFDRKD